MDRREHLKLLLAGSLGAGLLFTTTSCSEQELSESERILRERGAWEGYGRTPEEEARDARLFSETFFTERERQMIEILSDIIIPADDRSGSATDAGVTDFIEFMAKDLPELQLPLRGGLMWLDQLCRERFGSSLIECTERQRIEVIDEIAWPDRAAPGMEYGVRFFNRMRDLVATGFFTSQIGVEDLGYAGNRPNVWEGVPAEVLEKHGLQYDEKTLRVSVRPEERDRVAEWDDSGRLIG